MSLVKTDSEYLIRDTHNMALLNTDIHELEAYKNKTKIFNEQKNEINTLKEEVSDMRDDLSQIKLLLQELVKGKN